MSVPAKIVVTSDMKKALDDFGLLQKDIAAIRKEIKSTAESSVSFGLKFGAAFSIAGGLVNKIGSSFKDMMKLSAEAAAKNEEMVAAFTPLMGGDESSATVLLKDISKLADTAPFEIEKIADSVKTLMPAFDGSTEAAQKAFKMIGDTAQGDAQKLESITRAYTQAMLKNKVSMKEVNTIAGAGVPIYTELAKSLGVTETQMMNMVSAGKVSGQDLTKVFEQMTGDGGIFFEGMKISAETFNSTILGVQERFGTLLGLFGDKLLPVASDIVQTVYDAIGAFNEWVQEGDNLNEVLETSAIVVAGLTSGIGAYIVMSKAYVIWTALAAKAEVAHSSMSALATGAIIAKTKAVWALTAAMLANPIVWIAAGIAAVAAGAAWLVIQLRKGEEGFENIKIAGLKSSKFLIDAFAMVSPAILYPFNKAIEFFNFITGSQIPTLTEALKKASSGIDGMIGKSQKKLDELAAKNEKVRKDINKPMDKPTDNSSSGKSKAESEAETARKFNQQQIQDYEKLLGDKAFFDQRYQESKKLQLDYEAQDMINRGMNEIEVRKWAEEEKFKIAKAGSDKLRKVNQEAASLMLSSLGNAFNDLATVMENAGKSNREFLIAAKGLAIAQATISGIQAVMKTWETYGGTPWGAAAAAVMAATAAAKVAAIASTPIKAETGLQNYTVPQGYNNDNYPVMAKTGEQVTVTPKGESQEEEQYIIVNIEGKTLFSLINQGIKNGQINISQSNIGRRVHA